MEDQAASPTKAPAVHLIVLQHGLWGNTTCVSNLEAYLRQQLGPKHSAAPSTAGQEQQQEQQEEEVQILNSDVNRKALTYDGIDVCGARVVKMVLDCIQLLQGQGRQVAKLSFIGYSLGGLILRYAVGKLYVLGLFEEMACANFITIATPHLGSWRSPTSFWARFFNSHVAVVGSRTGRQLMLVDADYSVPWLTAQQQLHEAHTTHHPHHQHHQHSQSAPQQHQQQNQGAAAELPPGVVSGGQAVPLLLLMAHPAGPFHRALQGFRTRLVAANILYDAMVPYCTAALCMANPYEQHEAVSIDPARYPSVVRPAAVGEEVATKLTYKGRTRRLFLFALFSPLAPLLYAWTVFYGWLHHRSARRKTLEGSWLQQHQPAAAAAAVKGLDSSLSRSGSKSAAGSKQPLSLLPGGSARTAATLAAAPAAPAAAAVDGEGDAEAAPPATAAGLISTAVETAGVGVGNESLNGAQRSPLECAMQQLAAPTADADLPLSGQSSSDAAAAAAAPAAAGVFSRRRSDSLAAAVAHHQQEDELGQLSKQLSSSGSDGRQSGSKAGIKLGLTGSGESATVAAPAADGAAGGAGVSGDTTPAAAGAAVGRQKREGKVTVDGDGIVEAPGLLHLQQAWMAAQLFDKMPPCCVPDNTTRFAAAPAATAAVGTAGNSSGSGAAVSRTVKQEGWTQDPEQQQQQGLGAHTAATTTSGHNSGSSSSGGGGWHRVDSCTRHWHAHAAIIIRDYRFKGQSRDMFQYIADHMSL